MSTQKFNLDQANYTVNMLERVNKNIDDKFRDFKRVATNKLSRDWQGKAADAAHERLRQLEKDNETRLNVLQNYQNMLQQQVVPGYVQSEEANVRLSDLFK